ncbi:MAG: glutathione peroxidase [Zetaproteobacteria bacterium]|nr:glutathione peroxidase [Zetaproteobacteria bacterium]
METAEGKQVPQTTFKCRKDGDWHPLNAKDFFTNKTVVVFSLPGAFTPTCSSTHLPRYEELAATFYQNGVDHIACISVNDGFVMEAWGQNQNVTEVVLLPDGNGEFTDGIGMLVDKRDLGFGKRSWRYSMLVKNGTIEKMFIEPDKPGDPFEISDADTMLQYINPNAQMPAEVTIMTKPGCNFCLEAKQLLHEKAYSYEEIEMSGGVSYMSLRNLTGKSTAPQIFIDGQHIDGLDGLKAFFAG